MAKQKIEIDPIRQAEQAVQIFQNLKEACKMLTDMVDYNITTASKRVATLKEKEEKEFQKVQDSQTKMHI